MSNEREAIGLWGESEAVRHLKGKGIRILERRWRQGRGEIDVIGREGRVLVFVEVRVRTGGDGLGIYHSIGRRKWAVLRRTALAYVNQCPWRAAALRYDVVGIERSPEGALQTVHHWVGVERIGPQVRV